MELDIDLSTPSDDAIIGVPFFQGADAALVDLPTPTAETMKRRGFEGKAGQTVSLEVDGNTVVAIGLGSKEELDAEALRKAAARFVRSASTSPSACLHLAGLGIEGHDEAMRSQLVVEGALLAHYCFGEYKTKADERKLERLYLPGANSEGVERGRLVASAVSLARDLVNTPACDSTPKHLADKAAAVAGESGLAIRVYDENDIEREGFGGLLGVSLGSAQPPRLIEMTYEPESYNGTLAIVGKGITFDSGGLSLKPADGMMTMKTDMSGAADVIAVMSVIAKLAPSTRVQAYVAATENLPGPHATKPGDVLKARNGKTMEVLNTDAEGRLVLADALSLAVEKRPDAIVDLATLTGACVVALGNEIAGLMTNNDAFRSQVQDAAGRAGEDVWHLPLPAKYRKHIDSEIADIKNIGAPRGAAGTLTAGLFLKEFVADIPWVHLDIAGAARSDSDDAYIAKGATGFGVRTLIELIERFVKP